MSKSVILRKFQSSELIFDEDETRVILRFIFKSKVQVVNEIAIDDRIRSFAQGLLLEAVDASYALGFVHFLFGSVMNPGTSAKKVLTKFGRKAQKHWFKYAEEKDLINIKVYEAVRRDLDLAFGRVLLMYQNGTAKGSETHATFIAYKLDSGNKMIWG